MSLSWLVPWGDRLYNCFFSRYAIVKTVTVLVSYPTPLGLGDKSLERGGPCYRGSVFSGARVIVKPVAGGGVVTQEFRGSGGTPWIRSLGDPSLEGHLPDSWINAVELSLLLCYTDEQYISLSPLLRLQPRSLVLPSSYILNQRPHQTIY